MRSVRSFLVRFGRVFRRARIDRDMAEELESHVEMQTEENIRLGMTPREPTSFRSSAVGGSVCSVPTSRGSRRLTRFRRRCAW
jgi:hypothetical protein